MEYVEPIRERKKIEAMKKVFRGYDDTKYFVLFTLGINSALRITDLLQLTFEDIAGENGKVKERLLLKEKKTKKRKSIAFPPNVKKVLQDYINQHEGIEPTTPLFYSRKKDKEGNKQAISRQMAYMRIKEVAQAVGLENIGTHTMRKTWGFHAYKKGKDITLIQEALNHSSPSVTLRYIGITQLDIDNLTIEMDL